MNSATATPAVLSPWQRAWAGLTPLVLAIVLLLLFGRAVSYTIAAGATSAAELVRTMLWTVYHMLLMAGPIVLAVVATGNLGPQRGVARVAALAAAVGTATALGALLRLSSREVFGVGPPWSQAGAFVLAVWPRYALLGALFTLAFELQRAEGRSERALQQATLQRESFERDRAEARLQVLQAQIEPHFLFNTLATLRRLYDADVARGDAMLDSLQRYLEAALPRMRDATPTLADDLRLVAAYLEVQRVRMGDRLQYAIDLPPALRDHPVPPMMLLTLVENAIKHGLHPLARGGSVRVAARTHAGRLELSVSDDGAGFAPDSGTGTGLANLRARLTAQFGREGDLMVQSNQRGGTAATVLLPLGHAWR